MGRNKKDFDGVIQPPAASPEQIKSSAEKLKKARAAKPDLPGVKYSKRGEEGTQQVSMEETIREGDTAIGGGSAKPDFPKSKFGRPIKPGAKQGSGGILGHLQTAHTTLQSHIDALRPHQGAHEALGAVIDMAGGMADQSTKHLERANAAMRGYKIGDKFYNTQHEAPGHLAKAHKLLSDAHALMSHPFIQHATNHFGISAGNADPSLGAASGGLGMARTKRGPNPFTKVNIAGRMMPRGVLVDPNNPEHTKLTKDIMSKVRGTVLGEKLEAAERGTPRGQKATIRPDRPGSRARRDVRFSSRANPSRNTPQPFTDSMGDVKE